MAFLSKRACRLAGVMVLALAARSLAADAEIATMRQRLVDSLLPTENEPRTTIVHAASRAEGSQQTDGSWADIDYADDGRSAWKLQQHLERTLTMAKACEMNRRNKTPNDAMVRKTLRAVDWWTAHDPKNPNWWWNEIGVPQFMGEIMVLVQSDASPQQVAKVVAIMKRSKWEKWTGQNLVWGCINEVTRGCIENDASVVGEGYTRMYQEVVIEPRDKEGIQADFSFHQHGKQFYSGGYGLDFAQDVTRFSTFAWGTKWQMPENAVAVFNPFMLDGEQWMMHNSRFDFSALGREITRKGKTAVSKSWSIGPVAPAGAAYTLLNAVEMMSRLPVPRQKEWGDFALRMSDDPMAPAMSGNKMFWCSDYMAHHRPGWFASIKMFSTRIQNAELVNNEGKKSHHLSDGAMLLYRSGVEYTDVFPVWDWCRVPGTTAEQVEDLEKWEPGGNHVRGKTDFVGGVSDGTTGIAAMDLQRGKLRAKKAYVCTEDGVLCLGAGISCDSDNEVVTSVNQCRTERHMENANDLSWIYHDGVGYVFPGKQKVTVTTTPQGGRWSDLGTGSTEELEEPVFNLSIPHGKHASNASYVYFVAPGATMERVMDLSVKMDLQIVSNTDKAQIARNPKTGLTAAVFWEAGKAANIEADRPCVVLIHGGSVSVSDPTGKLDVVNVRVDDVPYRIDLPKGDHAGASVSIKMKPAGLEGL